MEKRSSPPLLYSIMESNKFPIQATCADILKTALRLFCLAQQNGLIDKNILIVLTAHDEIVFQCPQRLSPKVQNQVIAILVTAANKLLQPLEPQIEVEVECGVGDSWADKP